MSLATVTKTLEPTANRSDPRQRNLLAEYFRDVGGLPVIRAQQEFDFGRAIEAEEIDLWEQILSRQAISRPILSLVARHLDPCPTEVTALSRSRATRAATRQAACRRAAEQLRAADPDREVLDLVLSQLNRLFRGEPDTIFAGLRAAARARGAAAYIDEARRRYRTSQRLRNDFVGANLRLVVTIARRFNFGTIPLNDLIQEGNLGLIKAVGRFDHRRGFRFSTYASWWIRHAITRAMADKGRMVRLPVHLLSTVQKVTRVSRDLNTQLGRPPTSEEISRSASLDQGKVEQILKQLPGPTVSLDNTMGDPDSRRFIELVVDEDSPSPVTTLGNQQVYTHVRQVLGELPPMELDILNRRFGLVDGEETTLEQIGASYELSRERIRQIQEQALGKIRQALVRRNAV